MYERLRDCPALNEYPSRIPALVWNVWRRYWTHVHRRPASAWKAFRPCQVICTVREYRQGAPKVRNKALQLMAEELEARLRKRCGTQDGAGHLPQVGAGLTR